MQNSFETVQGKIKFVLFTNKTRTWAFDWYQNQWHWMTLNGVMTVILHYSTKSTEFRSFGSQLREITITVCDTYEVHKI